MYLDLNGVLQRYASIHGTTRREYIAVEGVPQLERQGARHKSAASRLPMLGLGLSGVILYRGTNLAVDRTRVTYDVEQAHRSLF